MDQKTILLAQVAPATEAAIRLALTETRLHPLADLGLGKEELAGLQAVAAVVSVLENREQAFGLVANLAAAEVHVVVIGPARDPDLILRAMREGAREYLAITETDKLVEALKDRTRSSRDDGQGAVVAVFPAKGGVGATSIATNLAGTLARDGERVCLLDLDLAMGDALAFLDLSGGYTISDLIANQQRIDHQVLDVSVARHRSGVHVLAQTEKMDEASRVDPQSLVKLIHFLRQHYRRIVLDGLRTFDDHAVAALDACDHVLLLVTQEVPAVRRAQRCASFLRRLGHDESRVRLVVNRYAKAAEVKNDLIADTVGLQVSATVASDYPLLIRAINRGSLLVEEAPRSQLARDIAALKPLAGREPASKPSLLKRFFAPKTAHAS